MPEMHIRQPGFAYEVCEPITKKKKELKIQRNRRLTIYLSTRAR